MALERRPGDLQRPSAAGLILAGVGAVVVVLVVLAVLSTILWLIKVAVVIAALIGFFVLIGRMTASRR